ncbi:hypothetical protein SELMODRAFT_406159 [Selaginella moellendorffii]|uniref:Uncharacterized protein n=1 Tax=Selaginella moellendorffii TaxID=88036 RepID=D8R1G3_SELML|nr:hypothetical protein SELMODRAFT_406159 [Selaginella moellendorffii]
MEPLTAVPKLYTIESTACLGYCITQQGTQIVLKFKDALNPFQLWYRDESWQFLSEDNSDLSALLTVGDYDPAVENNSLLWSISGSSDNQVFVTETGNSSVFLSHTASSRSSFKDGVPVVTSSQGENSRWKIVAYGFCALVWQLLDLEAAKCGRNFKDAIMHNDETNVVAVSPNNISLDGMAWFKVPAGGRDNTTYFYLVYPNKQDWSSTQETSCSMINVTSFCNQFIYFPTKRMCLGINYCMLSSHFIALNEIFKATVGDYDPGASGDIHPWWKLPVEACHLRASQDHRILCHWFRNHLTWKQQNMDVTFKDVVKHNNKTNVVLVGPNNISLDSMVCNFDCNTMILDRTLMPETARGGQPDLDLEQFSGLGARGYLNNLGPSRPETARGGEPDLDLGQFLGPGARGYLNNLEPSRPETARGGKPDLDLGQFPGPGARGYLNNLRPSRPETA